MIRWFMSLPQLIPTTIPRSCASSKETKKRRRSFSKCSTKSQIANYPLQGHRLLLKNRNPVQWVSKIPALHFDRDWNVRIIPPFGGALARFQVRKGDNFASVYFDAYDRLGLEGHPYFELYPWENDVKRYSINEVDELIKDIRYLMNE